MLCFQAGIARDKQDHSANLSWVSNQNWSEFGQELLTVCTKLLKLEASLANQLQEIQGIRQSVQNNDDDSGNI